MKLSISTTMTTIVMPSHDIPYSKGHEIYNCNIIVTSVSNEIFQFQCFTLLCLCL